MASARIAPILFGFIRKATVLSSHGQCVDNRLLVDAISSITWLFMGVNWLFHFGQFGKNKIMGEGSNVSHCDGCTASDSAYNFQPLYARNH